MDKDNVNEREKLFALKVALEAVCRFKREHPKYNYLEWGTSKADKESLALECGARLREVCRQLRLLLRDIKVRGARIKECQGATYFPKQPWVGVFFKNEAPTNGVYPIVFFAEDGSGFVVGCTESLKIEQDGFSQKYCELDGLDEKFWADDKIKQFMDDEGRIVGTGMMVYETKIQQRMVVAAILCG